MAFFSAIFLYSALDKVLSNWVIGLALPTHFSLNWVDFCFGYSVEWVQELLIIGYLPHRFNSNSFLFSRF